MAKQDDYTRYTVRIPTPLYERIKDAAGEASVNAEIVATLEKAYPPKTIDVRELSDFLESLIGITAPDGDADYREHVMEALSKTKMGWAVEAGWDGAIRFIAHVNHMRKAGPEEPS